MALAATVEPEVKNVRLAYDVPATAASVTFSRTGPSGTPALVRGWLEEPVVGGAAIVARDFEAPLGVPLTYTAQPFNASGGALAAATVAITVPVTGDCDMWLNDLARAANTLQIVVEQLPQLSYAIPATVHEILGRRDPVVSSDIAHTPTFELSFLTETLDERDRATAILGNGVPVLLRTAPVDGIGNLYMAVLGFNEERITSDGELAARRFVATAQQVVRPDPELYGPLGLSTYAYVKATFATYAALKAARATYDAVLYDWSGAAPSDVVPWPPVDV